MERRPITPAIEVMYTNGSLKFTIYIFEHEPNQWIAQVLEKDIVGSGRSIEAAVCAMRETLQAHINFDTRHGRIPLAGLKRAPEEFWQASKFAVPTEVSASHKPETAKEILPAHFRALVAKDRTVYA